MILSQICLGRSALVVVVVDGVGAVVIVDHVIVAAVAVAAVAFEVVFTVTVIADAIDTVNVSSVVGTPVGVGTVVTVAVVSVKAVIPLTDINFSIVHFMFASATPSLVHFSNVAIFDVIVAVVVFVLADVFAVVVVVVVMLLILFSHRLRAEVLPDALRQFGSEADHLA